MKICDLLQNRIARFLWEKTGKPILLSIDWCEHHVGLTVFLLLLIGMSLRIGYCGMVERSMRDEHSYLVRVKEGVGATDATASVLLVHVGRVIDQLGLDVEIGMRCFNLVCSFLWLYMMYLLGKNVFSSKNAGIVCLTLVVFNPYTIRMAGQIMREPLYLLVLSSALLCAVQIVRGIHLLRYNLALGFLTALGMWSRFEGIEMLMLMPLAVVFLGVVMLCSKAGYSKQGRRFGAGILLYLMMLAITGAAVYFICPEYFHSLLQKTKGVSFSSFYSL